MRQPPIERAIRPSGAGAIAGQLLAHAPALLTALGAPGATAPPLSVQRSWSPMDGALPPYCPFVEHSAGVLTHAGWTVRVSASVSHWNESDVGGASASVHLEREGRSVAGAVGASTGSSVLSAMGLFPSTDAPEAAGYAAFVDWIERVLAG